MSGYVIKSDDNRYYVYDFYTNKYKLESLFNISNEFALSSYNVVCFSSKENADNFIKENNLKDVNVICIDCDPDNFISIMACFYLLNLTEENSWFNSEIKPTLMAKFKNKEDYEKALKEISLDIVKKKLKE